MSAPRCYLDYNASVPLRACARSAIVATLDLTGNPSSIHAEGRDVRRIVEDARARVGALVAAPADRVVFTSGATEAANLAVSPFLTGPSAPNGTVRLLAGASEHAAILQGHRFEAAHVTHLPVDPNGLLDRDALASALSNHGAGPALVAVQAANNETGVLQPLHSITELVHAAGGLVVCDAVQMVGRLPFSLTGSGADVTLLSSHKIGGSQGVGAIVLADRVSLGPAQIRGGGQERGARSGTENVAGIAGFGAAAEAASTLEAERLAGLQARLERGLMEIDAGVAIFGHGTPRLPNTTCFAVPDLSAETLLIALDLSGMSISSGSACSSGKVARSHVLDAMGVPAHLARGALRVSTGWGTTENDIDRFLTSFDAAIRRMRKQPLPAAA